MNTLLGVQSLGMVQVLSSKLIARLTLASQPVAYHPNASKVGPIQVVDTAPGLFGHIVHLNPW